MFFVVVVVGSFQLCLVLFFFWLFHEDAVLPRFSSCLVCCVSFFLKLLAKKPAIQDTEYSNSFNFPIVFAATFSIVLLFFCVFAHCYLYAWFIVAQIPTLLMFDCVKLDLTLHDGKWLWHFGGFDIQFIANTQSKQERKIQIKHVIHLCMFGVLVTHIKLKQPYHL